MSSWKAVDLQAILGGKPIQGKPSDSLLRNKRKHAAELILEHAHDRLSRVTQVDVTATQLLFLERVEDAHCRHIEAPGRAVDPTLPEAEPEPRPESKLNGCHRFV